jgi:hypothetical protein
MISARCRSALLVILIVSAVTVSGCTGQRQAKDYSKNGNQSPLMNESGSGLSALPACPADLKGYFTHIPTDLEKVDFIIPLGAAGGPAHVFPPDHVYFNMKDDGSGEMQYSPIYAPVGGYIGIIERQFFDKRDGKPIMPEYYFTLAPCKSLQIGYTHVRNISEKLKAAIRAVENDSTKTACNLYTFDGGFTSDNCNYKVEVWVEAGEQLAFSNKMDFGLHDYSRMQPFINPARYNDELYTICPFDPYPESLKEQLLDLMGDFGVRRTAEPRCGTIMLDIPGTAQGGWFGSPPTEKDLNNRVAMLIPMNYNTSINGIALGHAFPQQGLLEFTPRDSGTINRRFSGITPSETVYCYYNDGTHGGTEWKVFIQLVSNATIKIEQQNGTTCTGSESFVNPFTFER